MPPAPPTFSTTTCWPSSSLMRCAMMRPMVSCGPPAANGMTIVTGRVGKSSPLAGPSSASTAATAANSMFFIFIVSSTQATDPLRDARRRVKADDIPWLTDLHSVVRKLMQSLAGTVPADQVVVAKPIQVTGMDIGRMDDDIHVFLDRHRLIVTHQWTFDQIVALAMAVQARFGRPTVFSHEAVEGVPDILAGRAGLQQVERELARSFAKLEFILHRLRHFGADDAGATELGVHSARPVVFHEQRNLVTLLDDTVLQVPIGEFRRLAERH